MRTTTPRMRALGLRCVTTALAIAGFASVLPVAAPAAADAPPAAPATTSVVGRCTQYEEELRRAAPPGGWDVELMSSFISRESRCDPTARSARDTGLLQINDINHEYLRTALGEWVGRWSLTDPGQNIRAAAALCEYWQRRGESCYFPWKLDLLRPPTTPASPAPATNAPAAPVPAPAAPAVPPATAAPATPTTILATGAKPGRCAQYEPLLAANAPAAGWDVQRMSRLMFVTSGCNPARRWSTATGLLRISDVNQAWLRVQLRSDIGPAVLKDPIVNIRAAAALCQSSIARGKSCYQPWGG